MANLSSFTGSGGIKSIQRGNVPGFGTFYYSVSGGSATGDLDRTYDVTITSVNTNKAFLVFSQTGKLATGYSGGGNLIYINGQFAKGTILNSTTIRFVLPNPQLYNSGQDGYIDADIDWQVIEFN